MAEIIQTITVNYSDLKSEVRRSLSIIGKRAADKQGNVLFASVTLSSAEEDILKSYLKEAMESFVSNFADLAVCYMDNDFNVNIVLTRRRAKTGQVDAVASNFKSYASAYVTYQVTSVTATDIAKKYAESMTDKLNEAIKLIYAVEPPTSSGKALQDMKGEYTSGDKDDGTSDGKDEGASDKKLVTP